MSMNTSKINKQLYTYLRSLSYKRVNGVVTADDAHRFLSRKGIRKNPNVRLSYINKTFSSHTFIPMGTAASSREQAKYRKITQWYAIA
jgi:hypothetical protein